MASEPRMLLTGGAFFEGPRWRDGRWWVSDFYRRTVSTVTPDGREEVQFEVAAQPSGLGWLPDGSLLVVSMTDRKLLRDAGAGRLEEYADLSNVATGYANDMVVDAAGRAWVGNFGFDLMSDAPPKATRLARVDPDRSVHVAADDLLFPNGSVVTPDGRTLLVGETFGNRVTAFTIADDGSLHDRRVWAQFAATPTPGTRAEVVRQMRVAPDGCALDAEGHLWIADAVGGRCIRVAPGGEVVDAVSVPDGQVVFACMLGGDDGRTLLLCCAPDSAAKRRAAAREAILMTAEVDVPHAGLP